MDDEEDNVAIQCEDEKSRSNEQIPPSQRNQMRKRDRIATKYGREEGEVSEEWRGVSDDNKPR